MFTISDFSNLTQWNDAGYTGKGVTVWVAEPYRSHSRSCRKRVLEAAPDANVIIARMSYGTKNGEISYFNVTENNDGTDKPPVPLEEFIEKNNIRIISASVSPSPFNKSGTTVGKYWEKIRDKYNLCLFCASGNDSDKDKPFEKNVAWMVGALVLRSKKLMRASYSNGGKGLDFAEYVGWWSGTSSATPFLAGKAAVLLQRYPKMTYQEMYEYMKMNCEDFGDIGEDPLYGWGMFKFPDVNEKWVSSSQDVVEDVVEDVKEEKPKNPLITSTDIIVDGIKKTVNRVMVDNENYIRLRDMDDVLGIVDVDYDSKNKLPIIKRK